MHRRMNRWARIHNPRVASPDYNLALPIFNLWWLLFHMPANASFMLPSLPYIVSMPKGMKIAQLVLFYHSRDSVTISTRYGRALGVCALV